MEMKGSRKKWLELQEYGTGWLVRVLPSGDPWLWVSLSQRMLIYRVTVYIQRAVARIPLNDRPEKVL